MLALRCFIGCLLMVAAIAKLSSDAGSPLVWWHYALSHLELLLAAGCISGFASPIVRRALLTLFAVFGGYAGYLLLVGADSCGCFGRVEVHPAWMLALDVFLLGLLYRWTPDLQVAELQPSRLLTCLTIYAVVALPMTALISAERSAEIVVLEPAGWSGRDLPIANHVDIGGQLAKGKWVLLLYHNNCGKCQEALPRYVQLAERLKHDASATRVALIETPPYGSQRPLASASYLSGRLSDDREWFVRTPVEITIDDGKVVSYEVPRSGVVE